MRSRDVIRDARRSTTALLVAVLAFGLSPFAWATPADADAETPITGTFPSGAEIPASVKVAGITLVAAFSDAGGDDFHYEYIDQDRTLDDWENLVAFRSHTGLSPEEATLQQLADIANDDPSTPYLVMEHEEFPEHRIVDCRFLLPANAEREIGYLEYNQWRFYPSESGVTYSVRYARRSYSRDEFTEEEIMAFESAWGRDRGRIFADLARLARLAP